MHIAVCDDNMGDRHQLERLLKRESDKRASTTGILYTDAYGNCNALLANPMRYDAYFIDVCKTEGITGLDVMNRLTETGVTSPIIMCCSDINYREYPLPDNVIFLDKPIKAEELSASLDHALLIKAQAEPLIELREDQDTTYVTETDILYAIQKGLHVNITLTDGRILHVSTDIANLFSHLERFPAFLVPTNKVIINGRHIAKLNKKKAVMTDGKIFKISKQCMAYAEEIYKEFHS